jgi:hypothetical protein
MFSFLTRPVGQFPVSVAINRFVNKYEAWLVIALGLILAFTPDYDRRHSWLRKPGLIFALILIAMGSFAIGYKLFLGGLKVHHFTRPVGQMVIATFLNWVFAVGLAWCALAIGVKVGFDTSQFGALTVGTAIALLLGQGVILPLYAWWRWSGERDLDKFAAEVGKVIEQGRSTRRSSDP